MSNNDSGKDARRREDIAHHTHEILVRWIAAKPGAGAEQVEGYAPFAIAAAEEILNICEALTEDPEVTAKREAAEIKAAEKAAKADQKAAEDQAKKDADAARLLAESEGQ